MVKIPLCLLCALLQSLLGAAGCMPLLIRARSSYGMGGQISTLEAVVRCGHSALKTGRSSCPLLVAAKWCPAPLLQTQDDPYCMSQGLREPQRVSAGFEPSESASWGLARILEGLKGSQQAATVGCTLMVAVPLGLGWGRGAGSAACRSLRPANMVRLLLLCCSTFSVASLLLPTSVPSCVPNNDISGLALIPRLIHCTHVSSQWRLHLHVQTSLTCVGEAHTQPVSCTASSNSNMMKVASYGP